MSGIVLFLGGLCCKKILIKNPNEFFKPHIPSLSKQFLNAIAIFFFGILLPITFSLIHASLRMRNLRNKINTAKTMVGLRQTPLGIFLDNFGLLDDLRVI